MEGSCSTTSSLPADFFFCAFTGGRVLFAGTDTGCIRAYKYPLNGEFQEFRCCGSAITQLMLTYDDAVLFASGQDGSLFVFDVKDKDPTRVVTKRCVYSAGEISSALFACLLACLPACLPACLIA